MKRLFIYIIPIFAFIVSCNNDDTITNPLLTSPTGVTTTMITEISQTGAISGGSITADGGSNITNRGVVWSTSSNPTIELSTKTNDATGIGSFNSTLNGLSAGTLYYVRAYATNSVGTTYGDEKTFTTATTPIPTSVYVAVQLQGSPNRALYWKDANTNNLSDGSRNAFAKSIFISNNDVYVAGEEHNTNNIYVAKYWKNGQTVELSNGIKHAFTTAIAVSGNNVYVSGSQETNAQRQAKYWVNGTENNLTDGTNHAVANAIFVSGNDVYVAGNMNIPMESARYWKNGVQTILSQSTSFVRSVANSIYVDGNDVYVAGYQQFNAANGGKYIATLWKNGVVTLLGNASNNSYATGVSVKNNNVYVAFYEEENAINVAKVWKNTAVLSILSNGSVAEQTASIFVTDQEEVYVAGYSGNVNTGIQAKYWKNEVSHTNNNGTYAWGIFVK